MTLKYKIFPLYTTALALTVLIIFFSVWHALKENLLSEADTILSNIIETSSAYIADEIENEEIDGAVEKLRSLENVLTPRLTFIQADGKVIFDSSADTETMLKHQDRPEIKSAFEREKGRAYRFSTTLKKKHLYHAKKLKSSEGNIYILRASLSDDEIFKTMPESMLKIAVFCVAAFIAGSLIILLISYKINSPLEEIKNQVANFAKGNFSRTIHPCGIFEIDQIIEQIDKMALEMKENIDKIKRNHKELNAVLSSMREALIAVDADGRVILANKSAIKFFNINEKNLSERRFIHEILRNSQIQEFLQDILDSKMELEEEIEIFDSKKIFLQARGTPLLSDEGKAIGAVLVLNDISKIKRLEDMRRDFVSNVSHEIRTPLTAIVGSVETLLDNDLKNKEKNKILKILSKHALRLNALVDDILTLSRIEQGIEELEIRDSSIAEIIDCSIEVCREKAEGKNIRIKTEIESFDWKVDSGLLQQAIINLIDNAIKYSDENSEVIVKATHNSGYCIISIQDYGCGIPQEHIPRIFERFYRVDKARSRELGGTGLGLSIVKYIVNAHRGEIKVESEVEKGSTFTIILPKKG